MATGDGPMVTLDTNVAIYALTDDPEKAATARHIVGRSGFMSVQVLDEVANVLLRKRKLDWPLVTAKLGELQDAIDDVLPITLAAHREAVRIARRYLVEFYDALMISVALTGGATTLYSEDMHHGLVIDGRLTIRNPFRESPTA